MVATLYETPPRTLLHGIPWETYEFMLNELESRPCA